MNEATISPQAMAVLRRKRPRGRLVVDIRKRNGETVSDVLLDDNGKIEGQIVDGQTGVLGIDPPLDANDIESVRLAEAKHGADPETEIDSGNR